MTAPDPRTAIPPRAVIFDIGNVLIGWDPDRLYAEFFPDPSERQSFYAETALKEMNFAIDLGAPIAETVAAKAAAHPAHADAIRAFDTRWVDMTAPSLTESWALLDRLKADGVPVFALSNFGTDTYARAQRIYPILCAFDREFISGHLGMAKPDPALYAHVEAETGLSGDALFFTDDRAENIATAAGFGWQTHQFRDPSGLAAALAAAGLPVPEVTP